MTEASRAWTGHPIESRYVKEPEQSGVEHMKTVPDTNDPVNHPKHYTQHPSGVEAIQVTEWMTFNLGNVVKYVWRSDLKGSAVEDLKKARFYLNREINRMEAEEIWDGGE